ncbi:uncharacterized skeletal organic matrix 5-like [Paramuricea clavata]|uniref:Uncharacterized skeletal organic matrix 5-like n=1 Tax=Paramuricea clavata TaxID=317549 RepID=A0A6S7IMB5_PARCT|nr:uncharacterized skeletal organic matrix 5-like [Paramuricea clavata]
MKLAFTVNMFDRKHSWIYRDVFWFVFVLSLAYLEEAESKCTEAFFKQIDGAGLTTIVLSTHRVKHLPYCAKHCSDNTEKCAGFKYRSPTNHLPNCEVLKAMGICRPNYNKSRTECEGDTWQFFQTVQDKPPHSKLNICKNGGTCVKEHCLSDDFRCICRGNFFGKFCNEVNETSASCEELHQIGGDLLNGVYSIQTKTDTRMTKTYCQMTSLEGCAGGGWTMVMKVDGHKKTFKYNSSYWSNEQTFNPIGGTSGFDDVETKLPTYWSTSFKELCIGMKVGNDS